MLSMRLSPRISTDTCCGFHGFILSWEHLSAGACRLYLFTRHNYNLSPLQIINQQQKEHDHECNKRP